MLGRAGWVMQGRGNWRDVLSTSLILTGSDVSVSFSFHLLYPQVHYTLVLQFTQSLWTDEDLMGILSKYISSAMQKPDAEQGLEPVY